MVAKIDPPSSVIVSASICSKFALTGRYPIVEGGEEYGLLLVIVSAVTGKVTQVDKLKGVEIFIQPFLFR